MEGLRVWNIFWTPPWQKNLEQFLLIQQFWLMGTTSIPQPVITTAQFPISASHAGMPRKSSLWSPIFRHFSGPSPAWFSRVWWRTCQEEIALTPRQVTWTMSSYHRSTLCHYTQVIQDKDCGKRVWGLTSQGQRTYWSVLFHSRPRVWLTAYTRLGGNVQHAETRKPTSPFPRMSLESPEDLCHVGEVPWDSLKLQLPLSKQRINAKQFAADYDNYLNINLLEQHPFCIWKWQCNKQITGFVAFTSILHWTAWLGQNLFRMLTTTIPVCFSCQTWHGSSLEHNWGNSTVFAILFLATSDISFRQHQPTLIVSILDQKHKQVKKQIVTVLQPFQSTSQPQMHFHNSFHFCCEIQPIPCLKKIKKCVYHS